MIALRREGEKKGNLLLMLLPTELRWRFRLWRISREIERDSGRREREQLRLGESTRVRESESESKRARESERKSE